MTEVQSCFLLAGPANVMTAYLYSKQCFFKTSGSTAPVPVRTGGGCQGWGGVSVKWERKKLGGAKGRVKLSVLLMDKRMS